MHDVRIGASAERDLLIGFDFYETQAEGLGQYFLDSLFSDIDALALCAGVHPKPISGCIAACPNAFLLPFITISTATPPLSSPCSTVVAIHVRYASHLARTETN